MAKMLKSGRFLWERRTTRPACFFNQDFVHFFCRILLCFSNKYLRSQLWLLPMAAEKQLLGFSKRCMMEKKTPRESSCSLVT